MDRHVPVAEALEERCLLSTVSSKDNILTIRGDLTTPNVISIRQGPSNKILITINGAAERAFNNNDLRAIVVFGGDADDVIAVSQRQREYKIRSTFVGNAGNDTLIGGNGRDELIGDNGNDLLVGNFDDDTLVGGNGNDSLLGGDSADLLFGGRGNDFIDGGGGQNIMFGNQGNDTLVASGGDRNELFGGDDEDSLVGGDGDDTIWGGGGADFITGGGGRNSTHAGEFPNIDKVISQLLPKIPT